MEKKPQKNNFYSETICGCGYPEGSMSDLLFSAAKKYPHAPSVRFMGRSISYSQCAEKVRKLRTGFMSLGIKKGDVVMACLPNIPEAVYTLYSLNSLGAVVCFTHPLSSPSELYDYYKKSEAVAIVAYSALSERFEKAFEDKEKPLLIYTGGETELSFLKKQLLKISESIKGKKLTCSENVMKFSQLLKCKDESFKAEDISAEDTAVMLFSGGTTGEAKAVLLSNLNLNATAISIGCACGYSLEGKSILAAMPVFHGFGLGVGIHTALSFGAKSVLVPHFKKSMLARIILREKPEFISGVPTFFEALRTNPYLAKADLGFLLGAFSGGDVLRPELKSNFEEFLRKHNSTVKIREGYGLTECVSAVTLMPLGLEKKGSVGLALNSTEIKICKRGTTDEAEVLAEGEICIFGPTVMKGYKNSDEEALRLHSDGKLWLHTGDIGYVDEDGYLYFKGRMKRIIVTSGYNIYPLSLEGIISEHKRVSQCAVVGVKDPYKMERPKAFIVPKGEVSDAEEFKKSIIDFQKDRVARYSVVKDIELKEKLPLTKLGKIDVKKLSEEANRATPVS